MSQALIDFIPLEFSKYQRQVATALIENFKVTQPEKQIFTLRGSEKESPLTNPFSCEDNYQEKTLMLEVKTGATRGVLLPELIRVNINIEFYTPSKIWQLSLWQDWHKPLLPGVNVLTAQQSALKDISFLIQYPTASASERLIEKYCKEDYSLPEDLIGAPRAIAEFCSDNFDWSIKDDNSHLYLDAVDFAGPCLAPGVQILKKWEHWVTTEDLIEKAIIFFKSDRCFFSRKFTAHWVDLSSPSNRKSAKAYKPKSIAIAITDFRQAQIIRESQKADYN
jgi:hypothetical protein